MKRKKSRRRRLSAESLEDRRLLSSDSGSFMSLGNLTASFAPDDTRVGFRSSELHSAFDAKFGAGQWQPVIERAIQTWAREADLDIGFVPDNGAAAGVYGPSQGDARFGDIRIFGVALGTEVWAEAISENSRGAGTWAGDIVFNVDADWRSLLDLETVAMHEFGHVLGLEHNDDLYSPMNAHGPSASVTPTATDIEALRAIHGARDSDPTEGDKGNDTPHDANRIKGNDDDESPEDIGFDGSQVWLQFGDLQGIDDVDVFELHLEDLYSGPLAVNLRTEGLSLAKVRFEIVNREEEVIASHVVDTPFGGNATLELPAVTPEEEYFVRVSSTGDAFWSQGDYALTVAEPSMLATEYSALLDWSSRIHKWFFDSRGAKRGFSYVPQSTVVIDPSDDSNDPPEDLGNVMELDPSTTSSSRVIYRTLGAVHEIAGVSYYRFTTPESIVADSKLLVNLESIDPNTLVPEISLRGFDNSVLSTEQLSVRFGATQLLVHGIQPRSTYLVRLETTGIESLFRSGSYSLNMEINDSHQSNEVFADAQLSDQDYRFSRPLYLAIPQVISFSLQADSFAGDVVEQTQVIFQLFNDQNELIHKIIAPLGTMRSMPGVLLDAGAYSLQISAVSHSPDIPVIDATLSGVIVTDPIGPLVAPVNRQPIYTCETGGDYCYPDSSRSYVPTRVGVNPVINLPAPPRIPLPPRTDQFLGGYDLIYSTNPRITNDTSGDGQVSPFDALMVINYLGNASASNFLAPFAGYIDTNADMMVSPLDALIVINDLARRDSST